MTLSGVNRMEGVDGMLSCECVIAGSPSVLFTLVGIVFPNCPLFSVAQCCQSVLNKSRHQGVENVQNGNPGVANRPYFWQCLVVPAFPRPFAVVPPSLFSSLETASSTMCSVCYESKA